MDKTNKKGQREVRLMTSFEVRANEKEEETYIVEGYASTFAPYIMYSYDGVDYFERIEPTAFQETDMSDVIMQYDHQGRVYARLSNKTLEVLVDETGLKIKADLSKTEEARKLYEDIKAGMIKDMSFAFTVKEDHYDSGSHTRVIDKIKKLYDVSAVSIPANPTTSIYISARSYFDGVIEAERTERFKNEQKKRKLELRKKLLKIKLEEI